MGKNTLLIELEDKFKELILIAKALVELSIMSVDEKSIEILQKKEELLIDKITQLDHLISKKYPDHQVAEIFPEQWKIIIKLLEGFQILNKEFVENISIRKKTIGKNIKDVEKQKDTVKIESKIYEHFSFFKEKK